MKSRTNKIAWWKNAVPIAILVLLVVFVSEILFPDVNEAGLVLEQINTQSDSTEISAIEADVATTKFTDFTDELSGLKKQL